MRTTINIDEHVLATAKDEARARGLTLGAYIQRVLQHERARPRQAHTGPELPVYHGKLLNGIDRMSNRELQEFMDKDLPPDTLR